MTHTQFRIDFKITGSYCIFFPFRCQHCKQLAPEYEKAAVALKQHWPKIQLAKVDCIAEKDLAQQQQISIYPTLRFYRHGKKQDYFGGRSAGGKVPVFILNIEIVFKQLVQV